jgi:putative phage-type endonuclease
MKQGSQEWHEFRATRGMASESACIMHESEFNPQTWRELYNVKTKAQEIFETPAMRYGKKFEPLAREHFIRQNRCDLVPTVESRAFTVRNIRDNDLIFELGASLDGKDSTGTVVEIKCPYAGSDSLLMRNLRGMKGQLLNDSEGFPRQYWWQLQHQMLVTEENQAIFYVWSPAETITVVVEANEADQARLLENWSRFMRFLLLAEAPPLAYADTVTRDDEAWANAAETWCASKKAFDAAQDMLDVAKLELISLSTHQRTQGCGVSVTQSCRPGAIDYKQVPELCDVDLEPYRKAGTKLYSVRGKKDD